MAENIPVSGEIDNTTVLLLGIGALAFFLLYSPSTSSAAGLQNQGFLTPNGLLPASGAGSSQAQIQTQAGFVTVPLAAISGADWSIPLFLTLDRSIPLGFWDTLFSVGSAVAGGIAEGASYLGNAIGTALSTANQVISGTVIPALVNASGTAATYIAEGAKDVWSGISTGASYVGSGLEWVGGQVVDLSKAAGGAILTEVKALPGQISNIGSEVWDFAKTAGGSAWDVVTGVATKVEDIATKSGILSTAGKAVGTYAAGVVANKLTNQSDVSTSSSNTTNSQQTTTGAIPTQNSVQQIPLGYLSRTSFDVPKAMIVRKMYNPQVLDTRLVTDDNTYNASVALGYKDMGVLGYCSPQPFYGSVQMISLYNPNTIDSIVVTNMDIIAQLQQLGYQSLGVIGYCKALA